MNQREEAPSVFLPHLPFHYYYDRHHLGTSFLVVLLFKSRLLLSLGIILRLLLDLHGNLHAFVYVAVYSAAALRHGD